MADEKYKVTVDGVETEVTLNDLLKGYMMQADYTKKSKSLASERERIQREIQEIEDLKAEAERASKWDQWYEYHKPKIEDALSGKKNYTEENLDFETGDAETSRLRREISEISKTVKSLEGIGKKEFDAMKSNNKRLERALRYSMELDALKERHSREYPDIPFDKGKLVDVAFGLNKEELNQQDWDVIYDRAYRDEFLNKEVDKRLVEKMRVEEEKLKAAKMAETGQVLKPFKLPEAVPEEPTKIAEDAIKILREERSKRGE